ncbi:MAG: hypothetical protein K1X50_05835 [Candidatus Promineofilum sp.]|nr:hypothetical protein [Promineifilum sp.]MCW5861589.1 hypothetical protein [Anaerolineae bacterium]
MKKRTAVLWLVALILAALVLPVSARSAAGTAPATLIDRAGGAYNGIDVTLQADAAPIPSGVTTLTLTVRPLRDAPNVYVEWQLPDGGTLLGGPAEDTLGPVAAGESRTITRQARFDAAGIYSVGAKAYYFPNRATSLAALGVLFFDVRADAPAAYTLDPRTPVYAPPATRPTIDKSALAGASGRAADGCFNVHGILTRENKMPLAKVVAEPGLPPGTPPLYSGSYQDQLGSAVPVHNILVEMREEDTFSDDSYGFTVTDATGNFRFNFCDDDGVLNDELELYFRVCAEVRDGDTLIARVENIDDQDLYCWNSNVIDSEGGDVDFDLSVYKLNQTQAAVFNIADAIYWGWRYWNNNTANSPALNSTVTVYWQGGNGQTGSRYNRQRTALILADDPSSTDEWDDSVIIHEWGHFADHQRSCYQNPGGAHSLPGVNAGVNATRLAFGEGYPDYYQAVARSLMPGSAALSFYVDPSGPTVDLENMRGVTAGGSDEGAIAALLWDFADATNDGSDTVNPGHTAVQRVYTDSAFQGNTQCDVSRFLQVWRKLGLPTDAATAATIVQNVNITLASLPVLPARAAETDAPAAPATTSAVPPLDFRWWNQVTMVVDNSSSMAGPPAAPKINTVKTIIGEQVSDLAPAPQGTEFNIYTFNAGSAAVNPLVQGKFFAPQIMPSVNGLAANGADAGCPVPGLGALSQAVADKFDGDVWLYTDGDSGDSLSPEQLRPALNDRRLRASIVLLGGCGSPARKEPDVGGQERTYLGLAADGSQSSGIVPYMLTALLSGGQFIYVAPDQLANAVDMVRAQLSHTAGAGRWSDYVSTGYTYRWDRLEPWEYQWFPANGLGQDAGQLSKNAQLRVNLPQPFNFYGDATSVVDVDQNGYIEMNPCLVDPQFCSDLFTQYLQILEADPALQWDFIPFPPNRNDDGPDTPDEYGYQVHVYTANYAFEWFIISTEGLGYYGPNNVAYRGYQAWLNYQTGEIRLLYNQLRQEAATSTIGLIDSLFFEGNNVTVSRNDVNGATGGMGYKFTPAPPQPAKTYEVEVDPLIGSVIFMQTGYSGDFAPMVVTRPDGAAVNCADTANVKCLTVNSKPGDNMVQFVQVKTNGAGGVFKATVAVGPSGNGTFSFNALAASDLVASGPGNHTLAAKTAHTFLVDLGRRSDDGQLQAYLRTPAGAAFGSPFVLYDDGAHGDGGAGDGRFGSAALNPPGVGAAYLWVEGITGGVAFKRSDPVPYNFQPLALRAEPARVEGFYASDTYVGFTATNQDSVQHCYAVQFNAPAGWRVNSPYTASGLCMAAGATAAPYAYVGRNLTNETLGEVGDVTLTLMEVNEGAITASSVAQVALYRPVAALAFDNPQIGPIRPNGTDTVEMTLNLYDDLGQPVGFSGMFNGDLSATGGTVTSPTFQYDNGRMPVVFTAGTTPGTATISVIAEGGLMAETTVALARPAAADIALSASPTNLSSAGQSSLTVTVRDLYGNPSAGATVRLSVSDDAGDQGTIGGSDTFEGATNTNGQMKATFVKTNGGTGAVVIRAELLDGPDGEVIDETSITLYLSGAQGQMRNFLPMVRR